MYRMSHLAEPFGKLGDSLYWPGSRHMTIFESYAPGMATKYEYLCEEIPGHGPGITDHMNRRAVEGWELMTGHVSPDHPLPHAWLIWRR